MSRAGAWLVCIVGALAEEEWLARARHELPSLEARRAREAAATGLQPSAPLAREDARGPESWCVRSRERCASFVGGPIYSLGGGRRVREEKKRKATRTEDRTLWKNAIGIQLHTHARTHRHRHAHTHTHTVDRAQASAALSAHARLSCYFDDAAAAERSFAQSARLEPASAATWHGLGRVRLGRGDGGAAAAFRRAASLEAASSPPLLPLLFHASALRLRDETCADETCAGDGATAAEEAAAAEALRRLTCEVVDAVLDTLRAADLERNSSALSVSSSSSAALCAALSELGREVSAVDEAKARRASAPRVVCFWCARKVALLSLFSPCPWSRRRGAYQRFRKRPASRNDLSPGRRGVGGRGVREDRGVAARFRAPRPTRAVVRARLRLGAAAARRARGRGRRGSRARDARAARRHGALKKASL